jgi:hypothetical protein
VVLVLENYEMEFQSAQLLDSARALVSLIDLCSFSHHWYYFSQAIVNQTGRLMFGGLM